MVGLMTPTTYWYSILPPQYAKPSWSIFSDANSDILTFLKTNNVEIENIANIETFLSNNHGMVAYLYDIPKKVSDYFGNTHLKLSVFSDPDQEGDFQQIFFEIDTHLPPKEANEKLSELNRDWLFKINDKDIYLLNFSLNFN